MRLKQFLYLQTVAKYKSITQASEKLFVSHQALSYALRKLEESYDVQLLDRIPQGVKLTPDGEDFLQIAAQILELNDQLEARFCRPPKKSNGLVGALKIVVPDIYITSVWPDIQRHLKKEYPGLQLFITSSDSYTIIAEVKEQSKDIGYISFITLNDSNLVVLPEELKFISVKRDHFVVAVSKQSGLSRKKSLLLKDIIEQSIVFLETDTLNDSGKYVIHNILTQYKKDFKSFTVDTEEAYCQCVKNGEMIAIGPKTNILQNIAGLYPQEVTIIPLGDKLVTEVGYIVHRDAVEDRRIQAFLEYYQQG